MQEVSTHRSIGVDLGSRYSYVCVLEDRKVVTRRRVRTGKTSFRRYFGDLGPADVTIEVGSQSRWVYFLLKELGHDVVVANARQIKLIAAGLQKSDAKDAEILARLRAFDPTLLAPIQHRGQEAQADLVKIRARDCLVRERTRLINFVRGTVRSFGDALPQCSAESFLRKAAGLIPTELRGALRGPLSALETVNEQIRAADREVEAMTRAQYPEAQALQQVPGVGPVTALTFLLTLEDPKRFRARDVGAFVGLVPKSRQSGDSDPQLRITKAGNKYLRTLLVNAAQYILGPFGPESDLRSWGLKLAERGGQNAKKRAIVAVARKLAVLLHRLWETNAEYRPSAASAAA